MKFSHELGEAGLAYADFGGMQVATHAPAVYRSADYAWCFNDEKVRRVIAAHIAVLACARAIPDTVDDLRALDTFAISRLAVNPSKTNRQCAAAAQRVGGLAAYYAALIYRGIRLGDNSVQLATELGIAPNAVRQTLCRLNITAKRLDAGTLPLCPKRRYARITGNRRGQGSYPCWDFAAAIKLRMAGSSYKELGAKFGVHQVTIWCAFKRAGIKTPHAHKTRPAGWKFNRYSALQMHAEGMSNSEIARTLGVDQSTVWYLVNKSPLAMKKGQPLSEPAPCTAPTSPNGG